jgi:RNA polymerase sigma-70 factor (ECF subfamily)
LKAHAEDQKLASRMLAGDQRAFDFFFSTYAQRLAAFAARRSSLDATGIEDVVQNTLVKAIRNLGRFRGEAALFTWLCGICRRELADLHRKAIRQPVHESFEAVSAATDTLLELPAADDLEPCAELELADHRGAIVTTLSVLPERYARALEWKYSDGFSVQEIAQMLGLTTIAAQSLLSRAREAFKECWLAEHAL